MQCESCEKNKVVKEYTDEYGTMEVCNPCYETLTWGEAEDPRESNINIYFILLFILILAVVFTVR